MGVFLLIPWLLVFALTIVLFIFTGFNLYCWAGVHFSWSYSLILIHLNFGLIFSFHFWSRDLLRELQKKYEILLMVLFILFGGVLASEALLFVSFLGIFSFIIFTNFRDVARRSFLSSR